METSNIIFNLFIILFVFSAIIKSFLTLLNINSMKEHFLKVPSEFEGKITLSEHQKAQNYTIHKSYYSLFKILFNLAITSLWLFFGGLDFLDQYTSQITDHPIYAGINFILAFNIIGSILYIPFDLYSTFIIEEKFGFNKTTLKVYIADLFKQTLISLIIGVPIIFFILKFVTVFPDYWWLYSYIFIMLTQFVLIWAYPKFIAPLFNKFEKLENRELEDKIQRLLVECKIKFKDFYVVNASIRSSHGNAYFTGFGKNKRIVFFDTLLKTLTNNEVLAVLSHELGHLKKKHILKSIILSSIILFFSFAILGIVMKSPELLRAFSNRANKAYILITIVLIVAPYFTFWLTPVFSWFSRKNEYEADTFAANYTNSADLISALTNMYKDNSSSLTPHRIYSAFYFSHPSAIERVNFLKNLKKS